MNKLTHYIGKQLLWNSFKAIKRNKAVQTFDTAQSAAIVFDILLPDSFKEIKEFAKFLESRNIKTSVIGYSTDKEPPEKLLLWPNFNIITRKEIKWYGKPKGDIAEVFFEKEYDLLFVLTKQYHLSIQYLQMLSRAKFKIGYFTEGENDLDLMINPVENPEDVSYFIEQVKKYISMLNPSN